MTKKVSIFYDKPREEKKDSHAQMTAKCAFCNFYFWGYAVQSAVVSFNWCHRKIIDPSLGSKLIKL